MLSLISNEEITNELNNSEDKIHDESETSEKENSEPLTKKRKFQYFNVVGQN